jgi:hypothetical protein
MLMPAIAELCGRQHFRELLYAQHGVVSHAQLLAEGLTSSQARHWVRIGRWQRLLPGVYATFTGPVPERALVCAAVLYAGPGAAAARATALWLAGVLDHPVRPIRVAVPPDRRVRTMPPVRVHTSRDLPDGVLPSIPRRMTVELAALDVCAELNSAKAVVDLVLQAVQRRATTPARLREALSRKARHPWRRLVLELTQESEAGVASALERRYLRDVERPHGLPRARRNRQETDARRKHYRDCRYLAWRLLVELDGRVAHTEAFRDMDRDNRSTLSGDATLRYGWHDVAGQPCRVAAQVAEMLVQRGWTGKPKRCGPACQVDHGGSA